MLILKGCVVILSLRSGQLTCTVVWKRTLTPQRLCCRRNYTDPGKENEMFTKRILWNLKARSFKCTLVNVVKVKFIIPRLRPPHWIRSYVLGCPPSTLKESLWTTPADERLRGSQALRACSTELPLRHRATMRAIKVYAPCPPHFIKCPGDTSHLHWILQVTERVHIHCLILILTIKGERGDGQRVRRPPCYKALSDAVACPGAVTNRSEAPAFTLPRIQTLLVRSKA